MIFTTATVPYRTVPSELFRQHGDTNGYPGSVIQSKTIAIPDAPVVSWNIFVANLPQTIIQKHSLLKATPPAFDAIWTHNIEVPISYPPIGIHFVQESESTFEKIKSLGFVQDTHGKTRYFRGTIHPGHESAVAALGPHKNTFRPAGLSDFEGMSAFIIMSRTIFSVLETRSPLVQCIL